MFIKGLKRFEKQTAKINILKKLKISLHDNLKLQAVYLVSLYFFFN